MSCRTAPIEPHDRSSWASCGTLTVTSQRPELPPPRRPQSIAWSPRIVAPKVAGSVPVGHPTSRTNDRQGPALSGSERHQDCCTTVGRDEVGCERRAVRPRGGAHHALLDAPVDPRGGGPPPRRGHAAPPGSPDHAASGVRAGRPLRHDPARVRGSPDPPGRVDPPLADPAGHGTALPAAPRCASRAAAERCAAVTDQHIPDLGAGGGREVERLIFFSDAVMAIAMTLLVIDLKLPESLGAMTSDADLRAALDGLGPRFLSVLLSFAVIAIWWNGHNRIFRNLERADGALVVLNLVFLGAIAFLPFPTALIGRYVDRPSAVVLYLSLIHISE